jgi:hypothetical protein
MTKSCFTAVYLVTCDLVVSVAAATIESDAADAEAAKAYRRLISQHHPDKLVAKCQPLPGLGL